MVGPVRIGMGDLSQILMAKFSGNAQEDLAVSSTVLFDLRLPRIMLAVLVGGALALAGTVLQGLFRNPLADPGLIGVSSGGALGAVFVIVLGSSLFPHRLAELGEWVIAVFAMIGGISFTLLIYRIGLVQGKPHMTTMLLVGIAINAFAAAMIGLLIYLASSEELRSLTYWSLGSLANASWKHVGVALLFTGVPAALIFSFARPLNAFLLGEAEAFHLGVSIKSVKRNLIFLSAAMVGGCVALCGIIGFVGLVVPHVVRLIMGPDHRTLLPGAALLGAFVLVVADLVSRSIVPPAELPIGIVTALLGAPFFLSLVWRAKWGSLS